MVNTLDCYAGGLPFESGILPLLKHACGQQQLAAMVHVKMVVSATPEVNVRESKSYMTLPSGNKAIPRRSV